MLLPHHGEITHIRIGNVYSDFCAPQLQYDVMEKFHPCIDRDIAWYLTSMLCDLPIVLPSVSTLRQRYLCKEAER